MTGDNGAGATPGDRSDQTTRRGPYDPWRDVAANWPDLEIIERPLRGRLLGELRYPVIVLRAGTSAAQRRCTLAHEIVHLERGVTECGRWAAREELAVHLVASCRLLPIDLLAACIRDAGGTQHLAAVAQRADVDLDTLRLRLARLSAADCARIRTREVVDLWSVA